MAPGPTASSGTSCCRFPTIPLRWRLFVDFIFTFGTTIIYFADIVTDIITLIMYHRQGWYTAFGLSVGFIIAPSILLAVLECQFLIRTYGKNAKWSTVVLRTLSNVPFQLTVIWDHCRLSYSYLTIWLDNLRKPDRNKGVQPGERHMSLSNLADIDDRLNTIQRNERIKPSAEVPASSDVPATRPIQDDHTWWKALTREQWLSHLNKMKLTESMLESLPQLLINLYLIVRYQETPVIQYLSAVLSYLSLCGGIVRYDKTLKDNEAERLMVDRTLLHSRAFATRLEWPQIFFLSVYKGSFLAARILALVYFTVFYSWYVLVVIVVHWAILMCFLVYLWYPSDINKVTRQLVQADYKFRAYMFLSQDFMSVFHNSLMGIFINVRPHTYAFLGQPYCYMFWFYLAYITENVLLYLAPGVMYSLHNNEADLVRYQYYTIMIFELTLNALGAFICILYYFSIHKMSPYTRNAYPFVARVQGVCCCAGLGSQPQKGWTVCKQAETSEIFYLRKEKLQEFKNMYNTVARINRKKGRSLECFVDERGDIFYAPRSRLFRRMPSPEEERTMEMINVGSRQSLDDIGKSNDTPIRQSSGNLAAAETEVLLASPDATSLQAGNPGTHGATASTSQEETAPKLPLNPPNESRRGDSSKIATEDSHSLERTPRQSSGSRRVHDETDRRLNRSSRSTQSDPSNFRPKQDHHRERRSQRAHRSERECRTDHHKHSKMRHSHEALKTPEQAKGLSDTNQQEQDQRSGPGVERTDLTEASLPRSNPVGQTWI